MLSTFFAPVLLFSNSTPNPESLISAADQLVPQRSAGEDAMNVPEAQLVLCTGCNMVLALPTGVPASFNNFMFNDDAALSFETYSTSTTILFIIEPAGIAKPKPLTCNIALTFDDWAQSSSVVNVLSTWVHPAGGAPGVASAAVVAVLEISVCAKACCIGELSNGNAIPLTKTRIVKKALLLNIPHVPLPMCEYILRALINFGCGKYVFQILILTLL
jgi:hypothetical protein